MTPAAKTGVNQSRPHPALVVLNRFGFGAQSQGSTSLRAIAADPRGFLKAELARPQVTELHAANLTSSGEGMAAFFAYRERIRLMTQRNAGTGAAGQQSGSPNSTPNGMTGGMANGAAGGAKSNGAPMGGNMAGANPAGSAPATSPARNANKTAPPANIVTETFVSETLARLVQTVNAQPGFAERLVAFWSNHFCISADRALPIRMMAGAYEREAIRPHALGSFGGMLKAVEQHPAMLIFLDNYVSIGPNSQAGRNRRRGLNENLAREILELHTLGVNGGYTQADVGALARILTGWSMAGEKSRLGAPGDFVFDRRAHEPGAHILLGKTYADTGVTQGEQALADLARHPATAKFAATKLVRHFIADEPPPQLVDKLARVFRDTQGDLKSMALALVDADESWSMPLTKIRAPYDFLLAIARLFNLDAFQMRGMGNLFQHSGQALWAPPGPNGYPDTQDHWASARAMKTRLDISLFFALRYARQFDPRRMLDIFAGEAASPETRRAVAGAESREQGLAIALMSPEFQRR